MLLPQDLASTGSSRPARQKVPPSGLADSHGLFRMDSARARFTSRLHAHNNLAGSAEPSRVARPKAVGLARTNSTGC